MLSLGRLLRHEVGIVMNKLFPTLAAVVLTFGAGMVQFVRADPPDANAQVASVQELKSQAFAALRLGKFDLGNELLSRAASASNDPNLARMHDWTNQFDTQLKTFSDQRHQAYDKAVADVQLLLKNHHDDYALDMTNRAMLLSDDKQAFHDLPWVKQLLASSIGRAADYEQSEDWLKATRLYADLAAIEPSVKDWKEKLKTVQRRVLLLLTYVPDDLRQIQDKESKERDQVDALLFPTTQPATPTTKPADQDEVANDDFRIDWHERLHDIRMSMLQSAMHDAAVNYYRDVTYKDLMLGGLSGLDAVVSTRGLEKAFPGLNDPSKRSAFLEFLDSKTAEAEAASGGNEQKRLDDLLSDDQDALLAVNARTVNLPEEVLVNEFASGALSGLDPFTTMIWPYDLDDFTRTTQGEFSGVGIWIKLGDDGSLDVVSPLEDSPAYKAGIKADDVITRINGKSDKGITTDQAVKTITGPSGTTVRLTVRSPDGAAKEYTLRRETIKVDSVKGYLHKPGGGWDYYVDPENKIAYLRITNFTKTTGDELDHAISEMGDQANGLILDLRGNPGGLLTAATDVADEFISEGVIVSTRPDRETPNQPTIAIAKPGENAFKKPMVVLVNQLSASASEIVSGALKDDHRAIVVGERTFGKGSVQMLFPVVGDHSAYLKLTTYHYYLPSGRCLHREENSTDWGVDPDLDVALTPEQMRDAITAREDMDILRDAEKPGSAAPSTQKSSPNLLAVDPQLSAALLVLRLQIAGAHML